MAYQWYTNGTPISGATSASYNVVDARSQHAGAYYVVVRDSVGSVTSASATLTVVDAPPQTFRDDFDQDRLSDIVFQNASGAIALGFVDGANLRSSSVLKQPSGSGDQLAPGGYSVVASADFDGDQREDVVLQDSIGSIAVWYVENQRLKRGEPVTPILPFDPNWKVVASADFNGDAEPDLVLQDANGNIEIWFMNGAKETHRGGPSPNSSGVLRIVGVGDFDRDGRSDLVLQETKGQVTVWLLDALLNQLDRVSLGTPSDANLRVVGIADWSGDGGPDLLFHHTGTGSLSLWLMNGIAKIDEQAVNQGPGDTWQIVAPN